MDNKVTSPLIKGAFLGVLFIAYSLIIQLAVDSKTAQRFQVIQFLIIIGGVIWACVSFAKQMNGAVTFGSVFSHGFKVTAILTIISILFTIVSLKFLFPEMMEKAIDAAKEEMMKNSSNKKMSEEQVDKNLSMMRNYFFPFAIMGVMLLNIFLGAIASLIGAAVAKKNPNNFPS